MKLVNLADLEEIQRQHDVSVLQREGDLDDHWVNLNESHLTYLTPEQRHLEEKKKSRVLRLLPTTLSSAILDSQERRQWSFVPSDFGHDLEPPTGPYRTGPTVHRLFEPPKHQNQAKPHSCVLKTPRFPVGDRGIKTTAEMKLERDQQRLNMLYRRFAAQWTRREIFSNVFEESYVPTESFPPDTDYLDVGRRLNDVDRCRPLQEVSDVQAA
eukprot:Blabericola_migrator_1__11015@NODE_639_length_7121_cov_24_942586_g470_i0_p5_GENE_NODE_639_length_7121_cov_24_942586_g470_i0NODE_639_length_7121_cov_24_942586_g470_i0_p5_ORF_typecomplete_len212_score22_25CDC24_OB2/PF17245_2/0_081Acetyltransf_6/PF13480_7/0_18_NODE_639_length_7121_cov_24_942586_g470_i047585393